MEKLTMLSSCEFDRYIVMLENQSKIRMSSFVPPLSRGCEIAQCFVRHTYGNNLHAIICGPDCASHRNSRRTALIYTGNGADGELNLD